MVVLHRRRILLAFACFTLLAGCMDLFHELKPSRLRRLNHGPGMNRTHFSVDDAVPEVRTDATQEN